MLLLRFSLRLVRLLVALALVCVAAGLTVALATTTVAAALAPLTPSNMLEPALRYFSNAPPLPPAPKDPPERSVVLARDGSVLAYLMGTENRVRLTREEIPDLVVHALLASEDNRFYEHPGVDYVGIVRAAVANLRAGHVEQGASTITQQLVDNSYAPQPRTMQGKIKEAWHALQLEKRLTKEQILRQYLNRVYFGKGAYGIAAASERYFSKPIDELRVDQVAMLIGLVRAPSAFDPIDNPSTARQIRDAVLERMADSGRLSRAAADEAQARDLDLDPKEPPKPRFPFFVEYVRNELLTSPAFDDVLGTDRNEREELVYGGGLRVKTTLDPKMQRVARRSIRKVVKGKRSPQAAIVSVKPGSGNVRAMAVGPRKFGECDKAKKVRCDTTMVNAAVDGLGGSGRQPGSAFKPFVAAAALEEGVPRGWEFTTKGGKRIPGCKDGDGPYKPHNYSPDPGTKDMTTAMRVSNNVYFAKLAGLIGPKKVVKTAKTVGLDDAHLPAGCAIALGSGSVTPLEMAVGYATFAAEGERCAPRAVARIELAGRVHKIPQQCERALPKKTARKVTSLLREPVRAGTATSVRIGRPVAGKTGTTQDYRDAWFVGYIPQLATAAWIGFEQPKPMVDVLGRAHVTGGSVPAELWTRMMKRATQDMKRKSLSTLDMRRVRVPKLVGQRLAKVRDKHEYRFRFDVVRVEHHRPKGTIVKQNPRPGTRVDAGTTIVLRVSDGEGERSKKRDDGGGKSKKSRGEPTQSQDDRDDTPKQQKKQDDDARDPEPDEVEPAPVEPKPKDPVPEPEEVEPEPEPTTQPDPDPAPSEPEPDPDPEPTEPEPSEPEPSEPEPSEPEPELEPDETEGPAPTESADDR